NERALEELASRYQSHLDRHANVRPIDLCYTASAGRFHFPYRRALVADSLQEFKEQLKTSGFDRGSARDRRGHATSCQRIGLVFPDLPSAPLAISSDLHERSAAVRRAWA